MDIWKLWQSIIYGFFIGFSYFVIGQVFYVFLIAVNLLQPFVVESIFAVIVAVFSYRRIRSLKFGILFGLVVALVPEIFGIFFGFLPVGYMFWFVYPDFSVLFFAMSLFRFVGFPFAGFFGSNIWRIRKENF
jgi:hypothetical protein